MTMLTTTTESAVLTSWKDIAQYVGKGVRTVQRWEKESGFPIRRPKHGTKSTVLAFPGEINQWVSGQKFADGRVDYEDTDRAALLKRIVVLQAEVEQLRSLLRVDDARTA